MKYYSWMLTNLFEAGVVVHCTGCRSSGCSSYSIGGRMRAGRSAKALAVRRRTSVSPNIVVLSGCHTPNPTLSLWPPKLSTSDVGHLFDYAHAVVSRFVEGASAVSATKSSSAHLPCLLAELQCERVSMTGISHCTAAML